jgi:hypothetical protein
MKFAGIAPNLMEGRDAQEYITRMGRKEFPISQNFKAILGGALHSVNAPQKSRHNQYWTRRKINHARSNAISCTLFS